MCSYWAQISNFLKNGECINDACTHTFLGLSVVQRGMGTLFSRLFLARTISSDVLSVMRSFDRATSGVEDGTRLLSCSYRTPDTTTRCHDVFFFGGNWLQVVNETDDGLNALFSMMFMEEIQPTVYKRYIHF